MTELNPTPGLPSTLSGVDIDAVTAMANQILQSLESGETSHSPYADPGNSRFPISTPELVQASRMLYAKVSPEGMLRKSYSDEAWATIGETLNTAAAAHDSEEDIELVVLAMLIIRELMSRELMDGPVDSTYKLRELLLVLNELECVKWMEQEDVWREEYEKKNEEETYASTVDDPEVTTQEEDDDMAITDEDVQKIAAAVAEANAPVVAAIGEQTTAAIASLAEVLKAAFTPAAKTEEVVEAKNSTPDEDDEDDEEEAPPFPPKKKKAKAADEVEEVVEADEEEDDEVDEDAAAAADSEIPPAPAGAVANEDEDEEVEEEPERTSDDILRQAHASYQKATGSNMGRGSMMTEATLSTPEGRAAYHAKNKAKIARNLTAEVSVGVAEAGQGGDDIITRFLTANVFGKN